MGILDNHIRNFISLIQSCSGKDQPRKQYYRQTEHELKIWQKIYYEYFTLNF